MSSNSSAIQVTGVGPRFAFRFDTGASPTVDNVIGVDVTATRGGSGVYTVTHNLGHDGYVVLIAPEESADGTYCNCTAWGRGGNTFGIYCEDSTGTAVNPGFIHGIIYD